MIRATMLCQGVSTRVPKDHEYWVYIMTSASGTLYVGMTNHLGVRVRQHKAGEIVMASRKNITATGWFTTRATIGFIELLAVKAIKRMEAFQKDCIDGKPESPMERFI